MSKSKFIKIVKFLIFDDKKDKNELFYKIINKEFKNQNQRRKTIESLIKSNDSKILYSLVKYANLMKEQNIKILEKIISLKNISILAAILEDKLFPDYHKQIFNQILKSENTEILRDLLAEPEILTCEERKKVITIMINKQDKNNLLLLAKFNLLEINEEEKVNNFLYETCAD